MIKLGDLEQVVCDAGHQASDFLVIIETEGEFLIMGKKFISKVVLHSGADHVTDIGDKVVAAEFQGKKTEHDA